MKIRKGFVTNSSSSSFIIGYNDFESLSKKVEKGIKDNISVYHYVEEDEIPEYVGEALSLLLQNKVTLSEIQKLMPRIKEDMFWYNRCVMVYKGKDIVKSYTYAELKDNNSDVNKFLRGVVQKQVADLNRRMKHYKKFIYITVEDHTPLGDILEHFVLCKLSNTLYRFDNH